MGSVCEWHRQNEVSGVVLHSHCGLNKLNHETVWDVGQPQRQTATVVSKNKMFNYLFAIKSIFIHFFCQWQLEVVFFLFFLIFTGIGSKANTLCKNQPFIKLPFCQLTLLYHVSIRLQSPLSCTQHWNNMNVYHLALNVFLSLPKWRISAQTLCHDVCFVIIFVWSPPSLTTRFFCCGWSGLGA